MERYVMGVVTVVGGAVLIVARRRFAELQIQSQNQLWGFRLGPRSEAVSLRVAVLVGAIAIVMGLLMLAGVGKMRS